MLEHTSTIRGLSGYHTHSINYAFNTLHIKLLGTQKVEQVIHTLGSQ